MSNEIGLKPLKDMVYPGRVIIVGKSSTNDIVLMYAITGRSPSSQARRFELDETGKKILVKPTDEDVLKTGNPELLIYPALVLENSSTAISNGKHTESIVPFLNSNDSPVNILDRGLRDWDYEPDEPAYTPRISGCIKNDSAALSIIKRAKDGTSLKNYFKIPLIPGKGKMIATYTGVNVNPLPSFTGEPVDIDIEAINAEKCVNDLYDALGPLSGSDDFRVSAAAVFTKNKEDADISIKNRN
jgi:IMP cyclohydrolase